MHVKFVFYLSPAGGGTEGVLLEAVPDNDVPDLSMRLCRVRIFRVGEALPCVYFADTKARETYSKSDNTTKVHDDYGAINIGTVCPINYQNGDTEANTFTAQVVYELPPHSGIGPDLDGNTPATIYNREW